MRYGYDAFKRLTDVSFDAEGGVRYHYTYGNSGEVAQVEDKVLGTAIQSEYDLANRPMRKKNADASGEIYAAEVSYDPYNNPACFKERVAGEEEYETGYEYDNENRPTKVTYSNGVEVQYLYDGLGRVTKRTVIDDTDSQETAYTYVHGAGENTTPLIRRITQLGERIQYTYDKVGNILSVEYPDRQPETIPTELTLRTEDSELLYASSPGPNIVCLVTVYDGSDSSDVPVVDADGRQVYFGMIQDTVGRFELKGYADGRQKNKTSYQYDSLGQVIRSNDPFDPTAGAKGTTWLYSYNQGGNILSKAAYLFTEEETISEATVHTDIYTYENAGWKDQLTAYNGVPITYDAIGNPLNDGEWTYTWQHGRQLASISKASETVSFVYNEDGLRVQKTSTSTGATKYTLHGKNIVYLTNGNDELHFFYDAQGRVAVVDYNGAPYRYMHNLQGDVIALVDENGESVVEYWYDAWGKPLSKTGSMASTLGTVQPFRYRGYTFDEETGLYYLRSRYYNPEWDRFVNVDIYLADNPYCYCLNMPVLNADSDGDVCKYCGNNHIPLAGNVGDNLSTIRKNGLHNNKKKRIPWCQFIEWAYQMYEESWEYAPNDDNKGIWYGHVDCSGIHRLIMWWYYSKSAKNSLKLGSSTAGGIYDNAVYNQSNPRLNVLGKGQITESTVLVPGMGLFREGKNRKGKTTKIHMAIYVGGYFSGYTNAIIEAVAGGVVIRELDESEAINGAFTHFGFFKGVAY